MKPKPKPYLVVHPITPIEYSVDSFSYKKMKKSDLDWTQVTRTYTVRIIDEVGLPFCDCADANARRRRAKRKAKEDGIPLLEIMTDTLEKMDYCKHWNAVVRECKDRFAATLIMAYWQNETK